MPIAISVLAAALLTARAISGASISSDPPPLVVTVTAADDLPAGLVDRVLAEASAIWRQAGVTFAWRVDARRPATALRVTIGHGSGRTPSNDVLPLAWILFDTDTAPERDIYVSYDNVVLLMRRSQGVVGRVEDMPPAKMVVLLSRALGRALAHEIGHYLLASKVHTASGLMQTRRSVSELFSLYTSRFTLDATQRVQVAARVIRLMLAQQADAAGASGGASDMN
jgi:hypothetical protein